MEELVGFLLPGERLDVKCNALEFVLGLSYSEDGRGLIKNSRDVLNRILVLLADQNGVISEKAHFVIVNLSSDEKFENDLMRFVPEFLHHLQNPEWVHADKLCTVISNLSRSTTGAERLLHILTKGKQEDQPVSVPTLYQLVDIFCRQSKVASDNLANVFLNLSQLTETRLIFLDHSKGMLLRLLPYIQYMASSVRRGGTVGLCKNLCFEVGEHKWMLSEEVDLLSALLLPLAGPEQFEEEEVEQLPLDLQYLPEDKQREPDPVIRKILLEALLKLCCTKFGREYLRGKQTYLILRELHKWEEDLDAKQTCEKVVQVLIGDETEQDNLEEALPPDDHLQLRSN